MNNLESMYKELIVFLTGAIPKSILLVIVGFFVARFISFNLEKLTKKRNRLSNHNLHILRRLSFLIIFLIFIISAFEELGFHLNVLLGATGILTIALGIASQTSLTNLISGAFLLGERSFEIGDMIKINDFEGEVVSIDFLSVKIRTHDNNLIRMPNELLIKSAVINKSYFSTLRIDFSLELAYTEDISILQKILNEVAENNALCLKEPKPLVIIQKLTNGMMVVQCLVWGKRENYVDLKNQIQEEMKKALLKHDIPIYLPNYILGTCK